MLERSDILILAVKPYLIETVLAPIREKLAGKVLLSVAAGWPFQRFEEVLPAGVHHLSIMPNTPVAIGEGIVLLEEENSLSPQELSQAKELLAALGVVETVPSAQMGIAGTVAGCGPAYAALFLEALGDAGVLPRPAPGAFLPAGGPDAGGHREAPPGHRPAPRRHEGRGVLPGRHHHPGRGPAGAARLPRRCHRRRLRLGGGKEGIILYEKGGCCAAQQPTFFLSIRYVLHPSRACTQATESFRYSRAWLAP